MKLLYLTTALHPDDYQNIVNIGKSVPNPSNQNFHTKLIAYLEKNHEVRVISRRTNSKKLFTRHQEKDNYIYPGFLNIPIVRNFMTISSGISYGQKWPADYIIVDVLNLTLMELALRIKHKTNIPIIGVVTDNPINLSNVRNIYIQNVFKKAAQCDAFIGLTRSLLNLFNPQHKPTLKIPGFIPLNDLQSEKTTEEFAYFGGALYARYGVDILLDTFKKDPPLKLKVAGHGPLRQEILNLNSESIEFLNIITPEKALELSKMATININPRPFDSALEEYSIPSKLIDYIFAGKPTISTENKPIMNIVGNNVFWIKEVSVYCLTNAMETILAQKETWEAQALEAKKLLEISLGPEQFNQNFINLTKQIKN
ncbi:MAG TPA: glycosyltransferase [Bacilli bacterium]|nr:glycosyltransferase [Bacilli bacterium]